MLLDITSNHSNGCLQYQLNASGAINCHDLDEQLSVVWSRMVTYVGNLYDIVAHPVAFAIPWEDVRKGVVAGLVLTGLSRYMHWGGSAYRTIDKSSRFRSGANLVGPSTVKKQRTV